MAQIKNFPNNVDEYIGAESVMKWLHGRTSGVFGADGNLSVTANGDMSVNVSDGVGWLANSSADGTVFWNDTKQETGSELNLPFSLADAVNPRIDRVVVTWDTVDYAVKPSIEVLQGTAASSPVAPTLTNNTLKRQISLARVYIAAASSKITGDNITDERLDSSVCGIVTDWVSVDTTTMQQQFEAFVQATLEIRDNLETEYTEEFVRWFNAMKGQLTEDAAGHLQTEIDSLQTEIDSTAQRYTATFAASGWTSTTTGGYAYTQTANLTPVKEGAPAITADSVFLAPFFILATGTQAKDETLQEALGMITSGYSVASAGTVTTLVAEKPSVDITVYVTATTM